MGNVCGRGMYGQPFGTSLPLICEARGKSLPMYGLPSHRLNGGCLGGLCRASDFTRTLHDVTDAVDRDLHAVADGEPAMSFSDLHTQLPVQMSAYMLYFCVEFKSAGMTEIC
jgi:hypothetical protein